MTNRSPTGQTAPNQTDVLAPSIAGVCTAETMCRTLAKRSDPSAAKGFRPYWTTNLATHEEKFLGVAYHADRKDRGLMLNICPFCRGEPGYFKRAT